MRGVHFGQRIIMNTATTIDPASIERLRKIWALTESPNAGEAAAARARAKVFAAKYGYANADIPGLLATKAKTSTAGNGSAGFTFHNMNDPDHVRAFQAADRKRRTERARKEAPERAEVLARYGGLDAVLAWTEREQLLRSAVAQWSEFERPPHDRWISSIDGHRRETFSDAPARVITALSLAYALPATIAAAAAEYAAWERRDRDIGLAIEDTTDSQLDLPAYIRRDIVRRLLATGLRASSVTEILIRQRYLVNSGYSDTAVEQAVLMDLEKLAAGVGDTPKPPVQSGQPRMTTSARRSEVIKLLSKVDMSDREIARMVGVSPQTVGNLRRKHEASPLGNG
jgi:DNA-binding NarL/FixJ family response regulator